MVQGYHPWCDDTLDDLQRVLLHEKHVTKEIVSGIRLPGEHEHDIPISMEPHVLQLDPIDTDTSLAKESYSAIVVYTMVPCFGCHEQHRYIGQVGPCPGRSRLLNTSVHPWVVTCYVCGDELVGVIDGRIKGHWDGGETPWEGRNSRVENVADERRSSWFESNDSFDEMRAAVCQGPIERPRLRMRENNDWLLFNGVGM